MTSPDRARRQRDRERHDLFYPPGSDKDDDDEFTLPHPETTLHHRGKSVQRSPNGHVVLVGRDWFVPRDPAAAQREAGDGLGPASVWSRQETLPTLDLLDVATDTGFPQAYQEITVTVREDLPKSDLRMSGGRSPAPDDRDFRDGISTEHAGSSPARRGQRPAPPPSSLSPSPVSDRPRRRHHRHSSCRLSSPGTHGSLDEQAFALSSSSSSSSPVLSPTRSPRATGSYTPLPSPLTTCRHPRRSSSGRHSYRTPSHPFGETPVTGDSNGYNYNSSHPGDNMIHYPPGRAHISAAPPAIRRCDQPQPTFYNNNHNNDTYYYNGRGLYAHPHAAAFYQNQHPQAHADHPPGRPASYHYVRPRHGHSNYSHSQNNYGYPYYYAPNPWSSSLGPLPQPQPPPPRLPLRPAPHFPQAPAFGGDDRGPYYGGPVRRDQYHQQPQHRHHHNHHHHAAGGPRPYSSSYLGGGFR